MIFYITQYVFQQLPEERAWTCCIHMWVTHVDEETDSWVGFTALKNWVILLKEQFCLTAALHYDPFRLLYVDQMLSLQIATSVMDFSCNVFELDSKILHL